MRSLCRFSHPGPSRAHSRTRDWVQTLPDPVGGYQETQPAQKVVLPHPGRGNAEAHWVFEQAAEFVTPATFVARVPRGHVVGQNGAVLTDDGCVLGDLSREWFFDSDQHSLLFTLRLPNPTELQGLTANLATASGWNYFHWLTEVLPRLDILNKAGLALADVDWFVTNGTAPFQGDSLAWLGVPLDKIRVASKHSHFICETLLAPSPPGIPGEVPEWVVRFLREQFLAGFKPGSRRERIYISRTRSRFRRVTNEPEVNALLARHGHREVFLERLSFREQVELFAGCESVVAPHGAGLSNLVFCAPGTRVIELFAPGYINPCYWRIASWIGAHYQYLLGEGPVPARGVDPHRLEQDIAVDLGKLDRVLSYSP
jgi:capsular polysaccharide biosynthesis protein